MIKIYNTLTRKKENFTPLQEGKVGIYICGVTVYDYCHLGHARTYTSADVIIRYLRNRGYEVRHVQNITDIDDKIIKRAAENKEEVSHLTARFIQAMYEDFDALKIKRPDDEPRATGYIPQMIKLIQRILKNKHAYIAENGDVYFDVRSFGTYGCLSHHNLEQLESGARVEINDVKRDPLDFVLWKMAKPSEPAWDSPWGPGRPGWHIECSAMSMSLLGEEFDIHGGGRDLIFPHHENEIAQSQSASNKKFAHLWMHGGFLQIEKEKMSKSLGNFITIRDILKQHTAETLRYVLVASHYRSPLSYSDDLLQQAKQSLTRFYTALRGLPAAEVAEDSIYEKSFYAAMDDDFNTPVALSVLFELAHETQRLRDKDLPVAASLGALLKKLANKVLGILHEDPESYFKAGSSLSEDKILQLIAARENARREKNWAEADRIRDQLAAEAIVIEDGANGTTWRSAK